MLRSIRPLPRCLQCSSKLMVPCKLCSKTCLLVVRLSIPARTEGLAAQSIIQSIEGKSFRSDVQRISPWINFMFKSSSRRRFNSLPLLDKLSNPMIFTLRCSERRVFARLNPANPQIPVIKIFMVVLERVCFAD